MVGTSFSRRVAVIAAAAVVGVGGVAISSRSHDPGPTSAPTTTPTPDPGNANLWIDTSGGSCTRTPGVGAAYADASACASMQAAVAACTPSDTIRMVAGTYGSQSITTDRTSPGCTIIAENGTAAGALTTTGDWVEIRNVDFTGWTISNQSTGQPHDITLRSVDFSGRVFIDDCCDNISMIGGSVSGVQDGGNPGAVMVQSNSAAALSDFTFDGVEFTGADCTSSNPGNENHYETIRIQGTSSNVTIRNSWFHNNRINSSEIFMSSLSGSPGPIVIEGNYFDVSQAVTGCNLAQQGLRINGNFQSGACPDLTVQNNTSLSTLIAGLETTNFWSCSSGSGGNVKVRGNISVISSTLPCQATFNDNVWINASSVNCGTGDETVASTTAAGLIGDGFHISGSSVARANGYTSCPTTDRDGDLRPLPAATTCDAGADEVG